ncbi:uncharacterized protein EV420DRAFT_1485867 [Desarmillaria tabescens]|uniref:Uncharacterized protein n=1 Tax=Armillaria tabescens TaxID=1929756 RepID=A0AA39MNP6_ARMTA|nr:uncharacterized protein EV420DRAFT_1485867 [Desarmillaria tabescens]KAK0440658.1 hypothetical protein EV420DRAFT_1485867 [Desarmillaria tabescens]
MKEPREQRSVVGSRVASQASVPHAGLAQCWVCYCRCGLDVPNKIDAEIAKIFGSIKSARNLGTADRTHVIYAYNYTVYLYLPPLILFLLFMRNFYLGENQNAVQNIGIDGLALENNQADERKEEDAEKAPAK